MARIPDSEIERLKTEISLVRLVESSGVALTKRGGDEHVGKCPFHEDDTPSLSVSASKNLFNCFGCQAGGGPIDWVMKAIHTATHPARPITSADRYVLDGQTDTADTTGTIEEIEALFDALDREAEADELEYA